MDVRGTALAVVRCLAGLTAAALLCYNSLAAVIALSPYLLFYLKKRTRDEREALKWKLNLQFADALRSLSAALEAGYSVEKGLEEAYRDLSLTYGRTEPIMVELKAVIAKIRNSIPVEEAFRDLASRSGVEDIAAFADVFATAQRTGGNIIAIIRSTTDMIRTRTELKREVRSATASAKYESDIMKLVPFGMLLYLRIFSPDMVSPLYGDPKGIIFMTVVLVLYAVLCMISERMVKTDL